MKLREAIFERAVNAIGDAYGDSELFGWIATDIEKQLMREFGVGKIEDIPLAPCTRRVDWELYARAVIDEYELPLCVQDRIDITERSEKMKAVPTHRKCFKCGNTTTDISETKCKCGSYLYLMNQIYLPKVNKAPER